MDVAIASDPPQRLDAANKTPIADLNPELLDPASRAVCGVVIITWPYSFVKGTFSFILAEPDYRIRRNRGQIRVNLTGAPAKAASESGLSSNDEILVSLDGAEWEPEQAKKRQSLPGAGVDWQLKFSEKLLLQVTLTETGETKLIAVDYNLSAQTEPRIETPPTETSRVDDFSTESLETLTPPSKTHIAKLKDGEFESPAFIKRARMSYGSLFEDGYDIFEEDGGVRGRGRKRSRFGRESGAWKYTSQSPSPEPASPENRESSPPRPSMTDEGCQTMEIDYPMPSPIQADARLDAHVDATRKSLGPTSGEIHVTQPRQGMVDHGVQGTFQSGWPTMTSVPPPPFGPDNVLPSDSSELPAFHHTDHFHTGNNDFHQDWDPRSVGFTPTSYPHAPEHISPNDFVEEFGGQRPNKLGVIRSESRTRSPSEPSNLAIDPAEHDLGGNLPTDEHNYAIHSLPQSTDYPPLDIENEEHAGSNLEGAHLDYPASYLDDSRSFSQEAMPAGTTTFGPGVPLATDAGSSLWTTINDPPQPTGVSSADRLGSTEGESIENAVVIDESDSDDDPPAPTAAEDTVMEGHTDDLDMYDEAEVEDEVDAEYSEDDEPEYEADEIGGDYDTRNYTAPDDDEDDSHDEDLRQHRLEPEFDDGRSWEEEEDDEIEDEDAENPEYESEYEMDEDDAELKPSPQPISQSTPQVIDLISSSEDESEDDQASNPQPSPSLTNDTRPRIQSDVMPTSVLSKAIRRDVHNESEDDESDEAEPSDESDDGEVEDDDEMQDISAPSPDELESEPQLSENKVVGELPEEYGSEAGGSEDEDVATSFNLESQQNSTLPENLLINDQSVDQRRSPQPSKAGSISPDKDESEEDSQGARAEKGETVVPQSAAEGLEILSRVVENESKASNESTWPKDMRDDIGISSAPPKFYEPSMDHAQAVAKQSENESEDPQQDEEPVELVSTLSNGTLDPQLIGVDEDKQAEVVVPSSPQTNSFISQLPDENMTNIMIQENITNTEFRIPAIQLPTPQDTQAMRDDAVLEPSTSGLMEVDLPEEANSAAEPVEVVTYDALTSTENSSNANESSAVVKDAIIHVEKQHVESTSNSQRQTPLEGNAGEDMSSNHLHVSQGLSFQTQAGVDEMMQASFIESPPKVTGELEAGSHTYSDIEAETNGASVSFVSQMDEELQASILEYSREFEEAAHVDALSEHGSSNESENYDDQTHATDDEDEAHLESETQHSAPRGPSPDLGTQIQERRRSQQSFSAEEVNAAEQLSQVDPSVRLARAVNASRRQPKHHDITKDTYANGKKLPPVESSAATAEDLSVQLARASEESKSMTAAKLKLVRHLRDELPDCTSLKVIRQHLQKKLSVIAIAMMQPPDPQRARGGPREFMMSFTITDYSIGPYSVVEVQLYRPHKETLPIVKAGDVVLLRNFTVVSVHNKGFCLRTNDESSWAVFDQEDEPPQIKGPPVEYNGRETAYVAHLRAWFSLLDEKARAKLERANKKIIDAGRSK